MKKADIKVGEWYAVDPRSYKSRGDDKHLYGRKAKVTAVGVKRKVWSTYGYDSKDDGYTVEFAEPLDAGKYDGSTYSKKVVTGRDIYAVWDKAWEDEKRQAEQEIEQRRFQIQGETQQRDEIIDALAAYGVHVRKTWNSRTELILTVEDGRKIVLALVRARADAV